MDHQMNMQVRERFGQYYGRIPLTTSPSIVNGNALSLDWESVVTKAELSYILGNPPFLGARIMSKDQKNEVNQVFEEMKDCSNLDYVSCWYKKAARYIQGTDIEAAFVSTNSIIQGEQVPILWPELMNKHGIKINFAHHTFKWHNEAHGRAAVYCVIIGFGLSDWKVKKLYHYADVAGNATESTVNQINAYLIDGPMVFIGKETAPLCKVPEMVFGNMPNDGGGLLLTETERNAIASNEPDMLPFVRPYMGSDEFINNRTRYCLWLSESNPRIIRRNSLVKKRLEQVKSYREKSRRESTRRLAEYPGVFGEIRQTGDDYLLIPRVSSEKRIYIPMGFMSANVIASDACLIIPTATLYHFGVLTSTMHMAWTRRVCGRLKSDYRYSASIVYNNFPWPTSTIKQQTAIETAAQAVLDARARFPQSSLADLYDPVAMPPELVKAHQKLDKAVEAAYGRTFANDAERVAYLFELYQRLNAELFVDTKKRGKGKKI
jgi:hypothetical protein